LSLDLIVSKSELVSSLAKAVGFIPTATAGKTSVVYLKPQEGKLRVAVSYPDVAFSTLCRSRGEAPDNVVALYGRKFYDIVKQTSGDIRLTHEGAEFSIRCEGAKWVERPVRGSLEDPSFPEKVEAEIESHTLAEAFAEVQYVVDKATNVPSLSALDVHEGRIRGSNGSNYREVHTRVPGLTFQVSNSHVESFVKLLRRWSGKVEFSQTSTSYYFRHGDDVLLLRKLNTKFPDLDRSMVRPMKAQAQFILKVRRVDMEEVLRKVRVSSSEKFPYTELHLRQGELLARCVGDDEVEAVGKIEAIWNQTPRITTFNTHHLYAMVVNQTSEILEIRFAKDTKDRKSPAVIEGEDSWSLLTQLRMRPRG